MELIINDLESTKERIKRHFTRHPQASISALFRGLRKSQNLYFIGDYPLMKLIVVTMHELGIEVRKRPLQRAIQQSSELKGQKILSQQLLNDEMTVGNSAEVSGKASKMDKTTNASSKGGNTHV